MKKHRPINCCFCGDEQVLGTDEDVVPQWLADKLKYYAEKHHPGVQAVFRDYTYTNLEAFEADISSVGFGANAETAKLIGSRPTAYILPTVCTTCNGGWMSRLEQGANKLIPGFLEEKSKRIDPFDQLILALWTIKTCLTFDAAKVPQDIPSEQGSRQLFRLGYPLPGSYVWIGHDPDHIPEGAFAHKRIHLEVPQSGAPDTKATLFTFQFDHVLLSAIINHGDFLTEGAKYVVAAQGPELPYNEPIWPPREKFAWRSAAALIRRPPPPAVVQ